MTTPPVLALPDFAIEFVIETDACDNSIRDVLMQTGHPLAYMSKALSIRHQQLLVYENEMMAIVVAVQKRRSYLIGKHFTIKTDHQSIKYLIDQRISTPSQYKWLARLMVYDYSITYKKGQDNLVADALSRLPTIEVQFHTISHVSSDFVERIRTSYIADAHLQQLMQRLQQNPMINPLYLLRGGVLYRNGRIVVGVDKELRKEILQQLYDGAVRSKNPNSHALYSLQLYDGQS